MEQMTEHVVTVSRCGGCDPPLRDRIPSQQQQQQRMQGASSSPPPPHLDGLLIRHEHLEERDGHAAPGATGLAADARHLLLQAFQGANCIVPRLRSRSRPLRASPLVLMDKIEPWDPCILWTVPSCDRCKLTATSYAPKQRMH